MSENFEKIILEKLDNLEKGQNEQQKFNKDVQEKLDKLEKGQERLENRQENFEKNQQEFNMRILELYENLKNEVTDTKNELTKFSNHFTVFEFENNRKVDLLLENYDFDYKRFAKNNADIFDLQEKYSKHDCRITSLELKAAMP